MISFSIDKQRDKMNAEWMSRPVDSFKNKTKDQPLVLVLTSMEQALTFAYRLKGKLLNGPILGGAYIMHKRYGNFSDTLQANQPGNPDNAINQIVIANDSSKNIKK